MNTFSGKGKLGLIPIFAVLLMPLLGVGTASAIEVGETVNVAVPDLREFATPLEVHQFTCRAITDHAVWLVQDTCSVNNTGAPDDTTFVPKVVWGSSDTLNLVSPESFADLTAEFEANVWGPVTGVCGVPTDVDGDGKIVMVLAAIPTQYSVDQSTRSARRNMYVVDPELFEIEGVEMDVAYLNIHAYTDLPQTIPAAEEMRLWNTANLVAYMGMKTNDPDEEEWVMRGIAEYAQELVFGMTSSTPGGHGLAKCLVEFRKTPYLELINSSAGNPKYDYVASRGQQFLWFMYLAQRFGDDLIASVSQDAEHVGMESIAYAIDPTYNEETAVNDLVVPIYYDWLICNLHNDFRSDFAGGIYKYDFLEGTADENWAHAGMGVAFSMKFSSYPIEGLVAEEKLTTMLNGPIWAMQYVSFSDYDTNWNTYFNGMYSDGSGGNGAINSRWECKIVYCDDETGEFSAIEDMSMSDFFNSEFTLQDQNTYLILTNNNPGGAPDTRWYISQDADIPQTETAIHQNSVMSQYVTVYTALMDSETNELEGYDWVGPIFHASLGDSTASIKMTRFYQSVWTGLFSAWGSGTYELEFAGYDSTGLPVQGVRMLEVGFAYSDLKLELNDATLFVPRGGVPAGAMVTLAETDEFGLAVESSLPIGTARERMTGIVAGPVIFPDVNGTISFASATNEASIYRYTDQGWVKLNSWMQNGQVSATVDEGGVYALGEGIGVFSPEIPAQLVLGANAPNPFTAQTAISFGLPSAGSVRVNVFDMTGRLVNTLANEEMAAANHTLVWDGNDMNGQAVGAGVYFCRLEAAGQVLTQKMLKVQ